MAQSDRKTRRFEWILAAEQGRHAEALRRIAELVHDEFSHFSVPPEEELTEKLAALDNAIKEMSELGARIERLRMVAEATRTYAGSTDDDERERARHALLIALEDLDRFVPASDTP